MQLCPQPFATLAQPTWEGMSGIEDLMPPAELGAFGITDT